MYSILILMEYLLRMELWLELLEKTASTMQKSYSEYYLIRYIKLRYILVSVETRSIVVTIIASRN